MINYKIDGVDVLKTLDAEAGGDMIRMWSSSVNDCLRVAKENNIRGIRDIPGDNLSFLNEPEWHFVDKIHIDADKKNIYSIYNLKNLKYLSGNFSVPIDYSKFQTLESVSLEWNKNIKNFNKCTCVKYLTLSKFTEKDFSLIATFFELENLKVYYSKVESLNGLQNLNNLIRVDLDNLRKLTDVSALNVSHKKKLRKLFIYNSPVLMNITAIEHQDQLEMLQLVKIGEINSLKFIEDFHKLNTFGFNAKVKDGDKTILKRFKHSST